MTNSTNKTITEHEKRQEHEGYGEEDHKEDRERTATEKERRVADDVTEAPRQ